MSEAVEFRLKVLNNNLLLVMSGIVMAVSYLAIVFSAMLTYGVVLWVGQFVSWAFFIWALWGVVMFLGNSKRGWCRAMMQVLGEEYDDPPISDWADDLEERGAFEVSHEPE